jgi:glutamine amidotransferase
MIGAVWSSSEGSVLVASLTKLVYEAARNDPLLGRIARDTRHCHGFGFLLLYSNGRGYRLVYEKYDAADELGEGEESCRENLQALMYAVEEVAELIEGSEHGLLLFHARRASRGEPRGAMYAHPYTYTIASRQGPRLIALIHNGSVYKDAIASILGVDPAYYTDSQALTVWLARQLASGRTPGEALAEARKFTRSALDVVVADIAPSSSGLRARAYAYSYLPSSLDEKRVEYYKPVFYTAPGSRGYISSTILMLAKERDINLGKIQHEQDKVFTLELS